MGFHWINRMAPNVILVPLRSSCFLFLLSQVPSQAPGPRVHLFRSQQPSSPAPPSYHALKALPCTCLTVPFHASHLLLKALQSHLPLPSFSNLWCCLPVRSLFPFLKGPLFFVQPSFQGQLMVMPLQDDFSELPVRMTSLPHPFPESSSVRLCVYYPLAQTTFFWSPRKLPLGGNEGLTSQAMLTLHSDVGSSSRTT